ncbi:hypothetical protein [Duganella vulcania]|uniref:5-bromo-4-chloroindolyl phosphate hydrolysis protein n=1 Tax=Duganella vulcania TaxID=2692166 RepID=A0A845GCK0_9BURK|nr:hypothetical protein [Duganella vulcania]MYM92333.1 hypothetical protein [Duganella vulcania]
MEKTAVSQVGANRILGLRVAAGVGVVAVLALLKTVVLGALASGLGLLALGGIGCLFVGAFQALPLLGQKLENRLLAARKSEARANPIEQLQNYRLSKAKYLAAFKEAVGAIGAQVQSMSEMIDDRKKAKPDYDASQQERAVQQMRAAHQALVVKYKKGEEALRQLDEVIDDQKFKFKFGQAGQAAIKSLNSTSGEDVLNEMLAGEAFDSVRDNFNRVFADLELEGAKLNSAEKLSFNDGMTIDLMNVRLPAAEKVGG